MTSWPTTPVRANRDESEHEYDRSTWNRVDWFLLGAGVIVWCLVIPLLIWKVS